MKMFPILFSLFFLSFSYPPVESTIAMQRSNMLDTLEEIHVYDFKTLEPLLYTKSDTLCIVNFWAMWCGPCVKELPLFTLYGKNNPNVKIILVSLDFTEDIETKLKPFLKERGISSKVIVLDDPDANAWIDKVDPNWSGAIPFTIIFNNKNRSFHEGAFKDIQELENKVNNTIINK